jgi:hypothetical protein
LGNAKGVNDESNVITLSSISDKSNQLAN